MEREFVSYEQSLELKELGFDEPCFALYSAMEGENHKFLWATSSLDHIIEAQKKGHKFFDGSKGDKTRIQHFIKNSYAENTVTAPLYQQVFRWFREIHQLNGFVCPVYTKEINYVQEVFQYSYFIVDKELNKIPVVSTYEEAESECLKKLIEIVKSK